ncbi:MAG: Gfo/Idh/MocA family oxidoreductase [Verrucomicrobia bacterium]|nr:Gfo/Idh/MocA family oxidoreductase [Verrucomicrobiota bacterium]
MNPVRLGLVGIGGFGANHIRSLQRLRQDRTVELLAVADPAHSRHEEMLAPLRDQGVSCYNDYRDMLDLESGLEAIIICTPIPLHKRMAIDALQRGLFVYLEKPPVILSSDLQDLIALDAHQRTAVGFIGVSHPVMRASKERLMQGALGELLSIRVTASWPRPSWYYQRSNWAGKLSMNSEPVFDGPATNALSHYVHLPSFLANTGTIAHADLRWLEAELYRARPIEAYDTCCLRGEFQNDVEFCIGLTHACRHRTNVEIRLIGTRGSAAITVDRTTVHSTLVGPDTENPVVLDVNLRNFARGVRSGERFFTTMEDCIPFLDIVGAMWPSSGGIHNIPAPHVTTWTEEPNTIFHIADIESALGRVLDGATFTEQGLPWSIRPRRIVPGQYPSADLRMALRAHSTPSAEMAQVPA